MESRKVLKTTGTVLAQVALAASVTMGTVACEPAKEPANGSTVKPVPRATGELTVTVVGRVGGREVWKFCDGFSLIYVTEGNTGSSGIAVVPMAGECM